VSLVQVVSRTSDFVGSLSEFLVELAATLVLTEVFTGPVLLPPRVLFVSSKQWKPLLVQNKPWKTPGKLYSHSSARSLGEKCCQRTSHIRSAGCV